MAQHYTPIWDDWSAVTQELQPDEKGRLIDAIVAYDNGEDWRSIITGNERFVFPSYKARIERWQEVCESRKTKPAEDTDSDKTQQKKQNATKKTKVNKTHKDNDKDNDNDKDINNISPRPPDTDRRFEKFWSVYPRHEGKQDARKAFDKLKVDNALLETMVNAILKQKQSDQWSEPRYIPHPSTWLNGHRWEDEPTRAVGSKPKLLRSQDYHQRQYNGSDMEKTLGVDDLYTEVVS